jgi:hypothetical protein
MWTTLEGLGCRTRKGIGVLHSKKKQSQEAEVKIKQCISCFAVYPSDLTECPECGFKPEVKRAAEYEEDKTAVLEQITKEDVNITLDFREPSDCKSMGELYELAKHRGYKRGWAFHQGKLLGFI